MCKKKACGVIKEKEWAEIGWRRDDQVFRTQTDAQTAFNAAAYIQQRLRIRLSFS